MQRSLQTLSSWLPHRAQQWLKRLHFGLQLRSGRFRTPEPEYAELPSWVREGDWVVDVGANVGHYTVRLSGLVGPSGRVLAFEPVPDSFELLTSNLAVARARNVSLFNVAISSGEDLVGISVPRFGSGLLNYYEAKLTIPGGSLDVLTLPLDSVMPPRRVSLIKIDVEGHEVKALLGMRELLRRDHPRLVVEGTSSEVVELLAGLGYSGERLGTSPNTIYTPAEGAGSA